MAGILRFIAIVATVLTILGWSLVAAQTPDAAIKRAARRFRIETYRQFHSQRTTYDQRIALARQLFDRWHARGAAPDESKQVIDQQ